MKSKGRTFAAWGAGLLLAGSAFAVAEPVSAPPQATAGEAPTAPAPAALVEQSVPEHGVQEKADPGARLFMQKCAGCHTVGGGPLTGPDLKVVQAWPRQDIEPAVLRMEKNVGKLKPEDVATLVELLQAPDASGRLADESKRMSMAEMAKLEPANAGIGEALFEGRTPLANRGLACASCHGIAGSGGSLAVDLAGSYSRLGQVPLMSTIEGMTFPLMKAAYAGHPITKQEAIHLVKYLESAEAQAGTLRRSVPLHVIGPAGALLAYVGMSVGLRKRNRGVRAGLVRDAMRRGRS